MALELKLTWGSTTLNLLAGDAGFQLAKDGWTPGVAIAQNGIEPTPVSEPVRCILERSTEAQMIVSLQALEKMQRHAIAYVKDPDSTDPVKLSVQMADGSASQTAVVLSIDYNFGTTWYGGPFVSQHITSVNLMIERGGAWESGTNTVSASSPSAAVATRTDLGNLTGTMPLRIASFTVTNNTSGVALDRLWLGLRSTEKHGDQSKFVPVWELEDGTGSVVTNSDASGGEALSYSPAANDTWYKGGSISANNVITLLDLVQNYGLFNWLLRASTTDSSTVFQVRAHWGYSGMDDDEFVRGLPVQADYGWDVYGLGVQPMPLYSQKIQLVGAYDINYTIQLWVKRTAGTGSIYLDCLVPFPLDDGYFVIEGLGIDYGDSVLFGADVLGRQQCVTNASASNYVTSFPQFSGSSLQIPTGGASLIAVAARESSQIITDALTVGPASLISRWSSLV